MPKLPNLEGYPLDELNQLIASANKRIAELRGKRVKELQAELDRLGSEGTRSPRPARAPSRRPAQKRAAPADRQVAARFRGPKARSTQDAVQSPDGRAISGSKIVRYVRWNPRWLSRGVMHHGNSR